MQLAMNFSHEAAALVSVGRIDIDRCKTPDWPDMIEEASSYRPVAVHFGLDAGRGDLDSKDWTAITALLEQTSTPYLNLHLNPEVTDYPGIPVDTPDKNQAKLIVQNLIKDVATAVGRFGAERVIIENVTYRDATGTTLRTGVEPIVICQVVKETGCGLLLDLSHARIAACYLGIEEKEYISMLPTDRLREMHFTGLKWVNGKLKDHWPALPNDWQALSWALKRIDKGEWATPWLLTYEYGGVGDRFKGRSKPEVMVEQVPRLREMIST